MDQTPTINIEELRSSLTLNGWIIFIGMNVNIKHKHMAPKLNQSPRSKIKRKKTSKFQSAEKPLK